MDLNVVILPGMSMVLIALPWNPITIGIVQDVDALVMAIQSVEMVYVMVMRLMSLVLKIVMNPEPVTLVML
jgi:hypothetical protein